MKRALAPEGSFRRSTSSAASSAPAPTCRNPAKRETVEATGFSPWTPGSKKRGFSPGAFAPVAAHFAIRSLRLRTDHSPPRHPVLRPHSRCLLASPLAARPRTPLALLFGIPLLALLF